MSRQHIASLLLWLALAVSVLGGLGLYRFYLTAPELRVPDAEARWQLLMPVAVLLVVGALLLGKRSFREPTHLDSNGQ